MTHAWEAFHLRCAGRERRLVVLRALRAGLSMPWAFVDAGDVIEVVTPPAAGETAACAAARVLSPQVVGPVHEVCTFRAEVFPGGVVPDVFFRAYTATTSRLVDAVVGAAGNGGRADDHTVGSQLLAIYASLIPAVTDRRAAIAWHARWLERIAPPAARGTVPLDPRDPERLAALPAQRWRELTELQPGLAALAGSVAATVEPATDVPGTAHQRRAATATRMVVARLAHGQAVHLWGPGEPDQLHREAWVLRMLSVSPTSST